MNILRNLASDKHSSDLSREGNQRNHSSEKAANLLSLTGFFVRKKP